MSFIKSTKMLVIDMKSQIMIISNNGVTIIFISNIEGREEGLVDYSLMISIKMNTLLVGPTGTGKTHLTETMARGLGLPFVTVDCTSVTAAGYIGDSVDTILQTLINKADGDVKLAEKGVVFLDEIDKLRAKGETASTNKDPGGDQVQDSLLKLIEGTIMRVPTENLGVRSTTPYVEINTSGILFIAGGAFKGLDKIVEERLNSDKASGIGFGADLRTMEERSPEELQTCISNQDLSK